MYVCMHVCMYVCVYVCMYLCMYVCVRMYVCTYVYMYVCIYCMYVCKYSRMQPPYTILRVRIASSRSSLQLASAYDYSVPLAKNCSVLSLVLKPYNILGKSHRIRSTGPPLFLLLSRIPGLPLQKFFYSVGSKTSRV